ncbi:MAG: IS607 family transposase [Thermoproteota archaeon]|nr:MAG: IS607 family transposase [Candidatus Korarchaeota archaeon]
MDKTSVASKKLGIHPNTLRRWANEGRINYVRQPQGHRLYDVDSFLNQGKKIDRVKFIYARVSSRRQADDLSNQIKYLRERYPTHEFLQDYGSGLNFKRKGFCKLLEQVLSGAVSEIVVTHKDRLCRFGFDFFQKIAEHFDCKLVVLDEVKLSPQEELIQDLISIIHVFSCRIYGLRKYPSKIKEDKDLPKSE